MMLELQLATDYALQTMKVTVQALGQAMSTLVVQERPLWLNLMEIPVSEKVHFLYAPISQGGLFSNTVVNFAQQFLTVKKQIEAIKHILHSEWVGFQLWTPEAEFLFMPKAAPVKAAPTLPLCGLATRPVQQSSQRKVSLPAHQ